MKLEWVRKSQGAGVVVFIHGINSDCKRAFTNDESGAFWPQMLADDREVGELAVATFDYGTGVEAGTYGLDDASKSLATYLNSNHVFVGQPWLIFVAYSLGGLVARQHAVDYRRQLESAFKALGLFLVASPAGGSGWANWISRVKFFI